MGAMKITHGLICIILTNLLFIPGLKFERFFNETLIFHNSWIFLGNVGSNPVRVENFLATLYVLRAVTETMNNS